MFSKTLFRFDPAIPVFLHSAEGSGGGEGGNNPQPVDNTERDAAIAAAVQKKLDEIVAKSGGDLTEALTALIKKNNSLENAKNTAENRVVELQKQVPDEATKAELEAYRALGKPDEITTRLEAGQSAITERDNLHRDKVVRDDLKLTPNELLNTLLNGTQLVPEGEGEARQVFAINGEKKTPWIEFVESNPALKQALPALKAEESKPGAAWLPQPSGNEGKAPTDPAKGSLEQNKLIQNAF